MIYLLDTLKVLRCTTCPVRALLSKAPSLSPRLLLCLQHLPSRGDRSNAPVSKNNTRWRSRATERRTPVCFFPLFSFLENINGDAGFACPAVCANGRTGKAGLAGGAGGSSPVSAQSTTEASDGSTDAPIPPKSALRSAFLLQRTFYFFC